MPLIVIANETSIDALKDRLFKPGVSDADIARLHRAIKKANPGIDLTNLRPGTILTLPDAPEFVARADGSVGAVVSEAVGVARGDLGSRLEELAASARLRARADQNERKQLVGLLDSAEVRRMVDQDPAVQRGVESGPRGTRRRRSDRRRDPGGDQAGPVRVERGAHRARRPGAVTPAVPTIRDRMGRWHVTTSHATSSVEN